MNSIEYKLIEVLNKNNFEKRKRLFHIDDLSGYHYTIIQEITGKDRDSFILDKILNTVYENMQPLGSEFERIWDENIEDLYEN